MALGGVRPHRTRGVFTPHGICGLAGITRVGHLRQPSLAALTDSAGFANSCHGFVAYVVAGVTIGLAYVLPLVVPLVRCGPGWSMPRIRIRMPSIASRQSTAVGLGLRC